jgi:phosphatidylethanolamine-binding protein
MMVDLDIPSNQNPHTFLHWMQTGLTPATIASTIPSSNGSIQAFALFNMRNTGALVPYTQPNPPAQNPLSHRYTQILVDTSSMTSAALSTLQSAAKTRVGFDTNAVLRAAGLSNSVVAGNSFNVTNPGQASSLSSASAGNFSATSIGKGSVDIQESSQGGPAANSDSGGGLKAFGVASPGGGTLTTTISSAPAGPTSGLTKAGASSGAASSSAPDTFGWDAVSLVRLVVTTVGTAAFFNILGTV